MEEQYEQEYSVVITDLLAALRAKVVWIVLFTLFSALIGLSVSSFLIPQRYEASVSMIVNARAGTTTVVTSDDISNSQSLVNTYAIIIKSNTVLNRVIDELGLNMSYEELYEAVTVEAVNHTQVMKIAVQHEKPEMAKQIVDLITQIAPDIVKDAVEAGSCKVIGEVYVTEEPVSPDIRKNCLIAGMLGMLLCVGTILLKEIRSDYIVDDADVDRKLRIPVLGIIPDTEVK